MFSRRIDWELEENDLALALARKRRAGEPVCDLTASNPTRCGLPYPGAVIRKSLSSRKALRYEPDPRGDRDAREAIRGYYRERGAVVEADCIFLTASTSEGYGFLFKLLCDPGDEVLVPRPSYPLFDFLASLDAVRPVPYPLRFDGTWHVDFAALESSISERSRAFVVVHPNNPTGSYASGVERERMLALGAERGLALVADEVFLDFPLRGTSPPSFGGGGRGLVFTLGGLSKLAALPQVKLAWIAISGERERVREASMRLEHIADTYLTVGTPVQVAAPRLLELASEMAPLVSERTRRNLDFLEEAVRVAPAVTLLEPEGGWYAILRLPAIRSADEWALSFLEEDRVHVHPGGFFGLEPEASIVLSLLTAHDEMREGVDRILRRVSLGLDSLGA